MMKRSLVPVLVLLLVGLSTAAVNKGGPVGAPFTGFAGFMEVQQQYNSNMFYWLFPSMDGNPNAPLILWLEGGPGIPCAFSYVFLFCCAWINHFDSGSLEDPAGIGWSILSPTISHRIW